MERIELDFPAGSPLPGKALAGVVGSGDLEALYEPAADRALHVTICSSVSGGRQRWQHLIDRVGAARDLPAGRLDINDFGATPGVARLRIEQVFEEAAHV
ncbi:malonate decarboxylase acyl carrier protein [Martelella alba]|uniref:Malonate decarboxylase acyl carrier protein n=1 Tax=Martelella alba TaxID=2590451 RepID=A0ABY2SI36_9HYPH|nr:malonate decarboxylase acyl carrier protein [Martelella alba]TKI05031.1 malonate decarboxylase acyl carrier protein [Martelella alba]